MKTDVSQHVSNIACLQGGEVYRVSLLDRIGVSIGRCKETDSIGTTIGLFPCGSSDTRVV